ncbi:MULTISPECIES: ATP-binding protein [unclassified Streptomyces]|uniref:ATP-binding protein n=1 Tax=unclassified Streptomyces TaxID=2593676 RepID=UPI0005A66C8F|nr:MULTISPECIES: ATP-binding protein [unclassified Streptomyces]ODA69638.1 Histidine kinase-, DNA gyrase B-, and HSP90-like ATPase [Streptomyces sp. AVP053U2]
MELAPPPPAARPPVAWYSWWLMPLGLGSGTIAATFMSSERITVAVAGAAATATGVLCVRLLLRTRTRLSRTEETLRAAQVEQSQKSLQWQEQAAGRERDFAAERTAQAERSAEQKAAHERLLADRDTACESRLAQQEQVFEARLTELTERHDARLAEQAGHHEARLVEQAEAMEERLTHQLAAVAHLAGTQLPEAIERLRAGDAIDDLLPSVTQCVAAGVELQTELRRILRISLMALEEEFDRSTSAEQAVISIGNRIHVLTSKLRGRLHEMQGEHGRLPAVARALMELDQEIGPADCLAASVGVLGGSDRPGRQWQEPQRLLSVMRGGIGRIKDFHRVQLRRLPELGVDGGLVDHLTLIFAHLLDNAARYSPPTEPVVVSGKEVPNGVGIEIQDSGKGLSEEKKREAEHALAGTAPGAGIGGITEDANIGLRVVGVLARRYGIRVTFADSPWLGTSVVVVVPHTYFSPLPTATDVAPAPAAGTRAGAPALPWTAVTDDGEADLWPADSAEAPGSDTFPESAGAVDTTPGGLPRRRSSRRIEAEPPRTGRAGHGGRSTVTAVPPDASFTGLAAFATAGRDIAGRDTAGRDTGEHGSEERDTGAAPEAAAGDTPTGRESTKYRTEESDHTP